MLEIERGIYYSLNSTGAFIWAHLAEPIEVAALHERLTTEFDVDPQVARDDLMRLLDRLGEAGLIVVRRAAAI